VNCCSPEINGGGGWGVFNAIFGWTNSATYGSVISYNLYWVAVAIAFFCMRYFEKKGHWPLMKPKAKHMLDEGDERSEISDRGEGTSEETKTGVPGTSTVREVEA